MQVWDLVRNETIGDGTEVIIHNGKEEIEGYWFDDNIMDYYEDDVIDYTESENANRVDVYVAY